MSGIFKVLSSPSLSQICGILGCPRTVGMDEAVDKCVRAVGSRIKVENFLERSEAHWKGSREGK